MNLCKYKDVFGKPNEGFHSTRIGPFALLDILGTIIIAYILSKIWLVSFSYSLFCVFILGELLHWLFCVDTAFLKIFKTKTI